MDFAEGLKIKCLWTLRFTNVETGKERLVKYTNLVVTVGKEMIAKRLAGDGNDCNITYVAVGTDNTAPDPSDTTLGAELARKAVTSISRSGTSVVVRGFFGASEANGTLAELGLFGESASATPDSGTLFNRALISETKTSSETLSIECQIDIS